MAPCMQWRAQVLAGTTSAALFQHQALLPALGGVTWLLVGSPAPTSFNSAAAACRHGQKEARGDSCRCRPGSRGELDAVAYAGWAAAAPAANSLCLVPLHWRLAALQAAVSAGWPTLIAWQRAAGLASAARLLGSRRRRALPPAPPAP